MALGNGLVAYYKAENNPNDSSGNGLNGTNGTFQSSVKKLGSYATAQGAFNSDPNSVITVLNDPLLNFGVGAFSISFWQYRETGSGNYGIVSKYSAGNYFTLRSEGNNVHFATPGGGSEADLVSDFVVHQQWRHIVVTRSAAGLKKIYVQGVEGSSQSDTSSVSNTADLVIGSGGGHPSAVNLWSGYLDEIAFWNRELSSSEVTELYGAGAGLEIEVLPPESSDVISGITTATKGTPVTATLNTTSIEALTSVAANDYFNSHLNWKVVSFTFKHSSGKQSKEILFKNDGAGTFADVSVLYSSRARTGVFTLSEIRFVDYDGGSFIVASADLPAITTTVS